MSATRHRHVAGGVAAAAGLIAVTTLLARVFGFGRWLVFSGTVGNSCVGTVYSTANLLPNVLFEVAAGGALAAVAVPLIAGRVSRGEDEQADRIASALLTWALTVLLPLAALLMMAARPLSEFMLRDAGCEGAPDLASTMILVFAPQLPLYGVGIVLAGVLQAHRRFLGAALAPLLSSLVVIVSYLLFAVLAEGERGHLPALPGSATWMLAGGTTLGVVALSLPLLVPVRAAGVRLRPTWSFPPGVGARALTLAGAGVAALVAQQAAVFGTAWVANNRGGTGVINIYQYLQAVYLLPYAVLAVPVAMSAFPALATGDHTAREADLASAATLARSLRAVVVAMGAGAAVLVVVAGPVSSFFAAIDAGSRRQLLQAMPGGIASFAVGLVGLGLAAVLTRALYVRGRPSVAAAWVATGWVLAIAGPLLTLAKPVGAQRALQALGLFSTLGMTVTAAGLLLAVRGGWGPAALAGFARPAGVAAGAGAGVAAAGWWFTSTHPVHGAVLSLLTALAVGLAAVALYAGAVLLGDRETGRMLTSRLPRTSVR